MCFTYIYSARATNSPLHYDLSTALGFVFGQRLSLEFIKNKYPLLSSRSKIAYCKFNASFGSAEKNMKNALRHIAGDRYNEVVSLIENSAAPTLSNLNSNQISFQDAVNYLDEIEARAEGNIPSPILETLLTYQFEDKPAEEYIRGFRTIYRTTGHPKAK